MQNLPFSLDLFVFMLAGSEKHIVSTPRAKNV